MHLSEEFEELLDQGRSTVEKYLKNEDGCPLFAYGLQEDGEFIAVLASEEYTNLHDAMGGALQVLLPWALEGKIVASVICAPIPSGGASWPA